MAATWGITNTNHHHCPGCFDDILGPLWSGGYGVQRKVAGTAQGLHGFAQKAGMGLMGVGGLVAVIGGIIFLVVVCKALRWLK